MEVALFCSAALDGDFIAHQVAQSFNHRSLHLCHGPVRVDDLTPDVSGYPDLVHPERSFTGEVNLGHFRKVATMAEVESHAHTRTFRQRALAPARLFRYQP